MIHREYETLNPDEVLAGVFEFDLEMMSRRLFALPFSASYRFKYFFIKPLI
jgi:hypothetical protein